MFTRDGQPIGDFRKTWWRVCVKAGVGSMICRRCSEAVPGKKCEICKTRSLRYVGLLFHDLRRTTARNYRRLGVGETVIMRIGGWKTRSVFERYNIVTQTDVLDAVKKLEKAEREQAGPVRLAHDSVAVGTSVAAVTINSKPF